MTKTIAARAALIGAVLGMCLLTNSPAIAQASKSEGVSGQESVKLNEEDHAAIRNAFEQSMNDNNFIIAARRGDAPAMKRMLVRQGAPVSLNLIAQGVTFRTSNGQPVPQEVPNNGGICVRWQLVTWFSPNPSPGYYYTMWVCTKYISSADGTVTYDSPL
jgi:hypothetical protein